MRQRGSDFGGWIVVAGALAAACSPARHPPAKAAQPVNVAAVGPTDNAMPVETTCVDEAPIAAAGPGFRRTVPAVEQRIGAVRCKANEEVWRDDDDKIRVCTVAAEVHVAGVTIASGAYTHFFSDGRPDQTTLARPQTLRTASGREVQCGAQPATFAPNGDLRSCETTVAVVVGSVACRGGEDIAFDDQGRLQSAVLDAPYAAIGVTLPRGTSVSFHENGTLAGASLQEALHIRGRRIQGELQVHENGTLAEIRLAENAVVQGHAFPSDAQLTFRPSGQLRSAEFVSDSGFLPHGEEWTDTTHQTFTCAGSVASSQVKHVQDTMAEPP